MSDAGPGNETSIRVRYCEVDRMGFLHHGHYLAYFEEGRTELMRSLGVTYREVEDAGTLLVVVETGVRHKQPARYDELLTIRSCLTEVRGVRLRFEYDVTRGEELLATGHTVLASTDTDGRPRRLPEDLRRRMAVLAPDAMNRKDRPTTNVQGTS